MKDSRCFPLIPLVFASAIAMSLYFAAYLVLVLPESYVYVDHVKDMGNGPTTIFAVSNYRTGNGWVQSFFFPLETVDRAMRPKAWDFRLRKGQSLRSRAERPTES